MSESPSAAIISISAGLKLCTELGTTSLLAPGPFVLHGNFAVFGYGFCTFFDSWMIKISTLIQYI